MAIARKLQLSNFGSDLNLSTSLVDQLEKLAPGGVRTDVSMARMTRWKIGGIADCVLEPRSAQETSEAIKLLNDRQVPWLVMGHSSNLLVADEGIRGVVIKISSRMAACDIDGLQATAQAGIWVPHFAARIGKAGLTGIEHVIGIPGTLGGLVCMNGGSQRRGIGENLLQTTCVDRDGNLMRLSRADCKFSYRRSIIQRNGWIVLDAKFEFVKKDYRAIRREMIEILSSRRKKFPLKTPNCGSVFVSDPKMYEQHGPPGAVIERCGLKGKRVGDAAISKYHANFFVNEGNATAKEMLTLIHLARQEVSLRTTCELECEVRFVHPDCKIVPAHLVSP